MRVHTEKQSPNKICVSEEKRWQLNLSRQPVIGYCEATSLTLVYMEQLEAVRRLCVTVHNNELQVVYDAFILLEQSSYWHTDSSSQQQERVFPSDGDPESTWL